MRKVCIVSGPKSAGAKLLTAKLVELGVTAVRADLRMPGYLNIGWGRPGDVNKSLPPNKLWELQQCVKAGVSTVPFGNGPAVASQTGLVMGRALRHTEGSDITLFKNGVVIHKGRKAKQPDFYTGVIDKAAEYRVHVWRDKAVRNGAKQYKGEGQPNTLIWNWDNNFKLVYGVGVPNGAWQLAKAAVKACGLDFGAVDVIEGKDGKFYFLEVNTRPGIEGQSVNKYAEKIMLLAQEG